MDDDRTADESLHEAVNAELQWAARLEKASAEAFTVQVEVASRRHPQRLIAALGRLFDMIPLIESHHAVREEVRRERANARAEFVFIRGEIDGMRKDLSQLRAESAAMQQQLTRAASAFGVLREFYREWRKPAPTGAAQTKGVTK